MIGAQQKQAARVLAVAASLIFAAVAANADSGTLSTGRLFSNDFLGDGKDRWRTGSYVVSKVTGGRASQDAPSYSEKFLEWRFRSEIISPANTASPAPGDRRYVGSLSIGLHKHFRRGGWETSLGFDLVATGPSTRVSDFHQIVHDQIDQPVDAAVANQIEDRLHPTVLVELARVMPLSNNIALRPFMEAQAGVETLARAGLDITIGDQCQKVLRIRDVATGHRYRATPCVGMGRALLIGVDTARVFDSRYLPSKQGYELTDRRNRLRFGIELYGKRGYVFYGLTYLGREFVAQNEGQLVGSLNVGFNF